MQNHTVLFDPVSGESLQLMGQLLRQLKTAFFVENTDLVIAEVAHFHKVSLGDAQVMLEDSDYLRPVACQDAKYWVE